MPNSGEQHHSVTQKRKLVFYLTLVIREAERTDIRNISEQNSLKDLSKDLMNLFGEASSSFAGVVFKCESFTITAHKNMLAVRSPVFSSMYKNEMRERKKKNCRYL
ncbi:hypothetical protein TNCT_457181 [Trichonephila clavata]|uniref:BTB domain-containing protein n=1 Tax=Trichonephila clavata TaxID=2740835 RepID=A0A8X6IX41_TRICU|nr:hypothetical protein TNCT_457181 [Trichonephila clavata]